MDFDDLLERTLELLETDDDVRHQVASRCRHVLVDEYQDQGPGKKNHVLNLRAGTSDPVAGGRHWGGVVRRL